MRVLSFNPMNKQLKNNIAIGISILLSLAFIAAGVSKLMGLEMHTASFTKWAYPQWSIYLIGGLEVICAIGLLIPGIRRYVSGSLILIMLGAIFTHVFNEEMQRIIAPVILLVLNLLFIALQED